MDALKFTDQLRIEGVNFKGFGFIPKYVMLDRDLTLEAKAIYAYFCSFAGSGDSAFPGRNKILSDLNMSKDAYYKHLNLLTANEYLKIEQSRGDASFGKNIYTLVSNPKKIQDMIPETYTEGKIYSRIKVSGIKSGGYGMIPKSVMIDERLSIKAKGVYAYFCSLTGAGNSAFPSLDSILYYLGVSHRTYYKLYNSLVSLNYLSVVQRHLNGRLSVNDYYLNDNPDENEATEKRYEIMSDSDCKKQDAQNQDTDSQCLSGKVSDEKASEVSTKGGCKKQDARKQDTHIQDAQKQDTHLQDARKQDAQNQDINIINSFNTNNLYNKHSFNQDGVTEQLRESGIPYSNDFGLMTEVIHTLTGWDVLYPRGYRDDFEQGVYNLFNQALIDMCTSTRAMRLKSSLVTAEQVVDQLNTIMRVEDDYFDITDVSEPAMSNYIAGAAGGGVRNPLQYMKACIWDAMLTGNIGIYDLLRKN